MRKQAKSLWMAAALVMGLGVGFTAGARQESQAPSAAGLECFRNSDCDVVCGKGNGVCSSSQCFCIM
ncbi:hypothetical protein NR798_10085 [Archangium gephyra]|uniref:hypothetical protein n=1 Tax=Archangium gephyra TaxID=48 RepID=UPI0035D4F017